MYDNLLAWPRQRQATNAHHFSSFSFACSFFLALDDQPSRRAVSCLRSNNYCSLASPFVFSLSSCHHISPDLHFLRVSPRRKSASRKLPEASRFTISYTSHTHSSRTLGLGSGRLCSFPPQLQRIRALSGSRARSRNFTQYQPSLSGLTSSPNGSAFQFPDKMKGLIFFRAAGTEIWPPPLPKLVLVDTIC
jgi:hypothetical protein